MSTTPNTPPNPAPAPGAAPSPTPAPSPAPSAPAFDPTEARKRLGLPPKPVAAPAAAAPAPAPAPAPTPAPAPGTPAPAPAAAPAPAPQPAAPVAKKKPGKGDPTRVLTDVAKTIARGVEVIVENSNRPEPEPAPQKGPVDDFGSAEKRRYRVLERMEKLFPETAGTAQKYANSLRAIESYKTEWLKTNSGKQFNLQDEEHTGFLSQHDVRYDQDLYSEALADMRADERLKPIEQQLQAGQSVRQMQERAQREAPIVISHRDSTAKGFFTALESDFKKSVKEDGSLDSDAIKKLEDERPDVAEFVYETARSVENVASTAKQIELGHTIFNPSSVPAHALLFDVLVRAENDIRSLPPEKQLNADGKKFATSDEWAKMSPTEKKGYWHLSADEVSRIYADESAVVVNRRVKQMDAAFTKRSAKGAAPAPTPSPAPVTPAPTPSPTPAPAPAAALPSPAAVAAPIPAHTGKKEPENNNDLRSRWTRR